MTKTNFTSIDNNRLLEIIKNNEMPLIDIRREDEWEYYGIIETSHKITFFDEYGRYDEDYWFGELSKIIKTKEEPLVLICAHANRTKSLGKYLNELGFTNVYELDGGINYGWLDKGRETRRD
jgi:rhodanese-related sulfurtransferase